MVSAVASDRSLRASSSALAGAARAQASATETRRTRDEVIGGPPSGLSPELSGGEPRALRHRRELQPRDARMRVIESHRRGGEAAVGAGDDVFAPDDPGEADDPLGDQLRVLHEVGGVTDDTRNED